MDDKDFVMAKIVNIKNPQWVDTNKKMIDVFVQREGESEFAPFCAMDCDDEVAKDIFDRAIAGEFGEIAPIDLSIYATKVRNQRDTLLSKSDWTQMPDVPQATKDKWATYRQALRDITAQPDFPLSVVFPKEPV